MKFCRRFERFAASLVRCLSVASYARKASESATVQNGEHKFLVWILYIIISFFSYTMNDYPNYNFNHLIAELFQILPS